MKIVKFDGTFEGPGTYLNVPAQFYHAGMGTPTASLSNSLCQVIINESPLHARAACQQLNPDVVHDNARRAEIGSVAHRLALGAGQDIQVLEYDSYRKKAAQEDRDNALAADRIPVLRKDYDRAEALSGDLRKALERYLGVPINECLTEAVLVWQDGEGWRRARLDAALPDLTVLADVKTTEASVAPPVCSRRIYASNYHVQAGFYVGGADKLDPENTGRRVFGYVFAEQHAPHAISPPIELSEAGIDMARQQVKIGSAKWDACVKTNRWPGYGTEIYIAEPPSWALSQWGDRMMNDESLNPAAGIEHTGWSMGEKK